MVTHVTHGGNTGTAREALRFGDKESAEEDFTSLRFQDGDESGRLTFRQVLSSGWENHCDSCMTSLQTRSNTVPVVATECLIAKSTGTHTHK